MKVTHRTISTNDGFKVTESSNGYYSINGTNRNDKIELKFEVNSRMPSVGVYLNGRKVDTIPENKIKNLTINARGGDDVITVDPLINARISINGGAGNDRITCSDVNTRVRTGTGDDNVTIQKSLRPKLAGLTTNTRITSSGGADKIRWHSSQYKFSNSNYKFISTDKTSMAFINLTHRPVKV